MTDGEIEAVTASEDPYEAAMRFVEMGAATLLRFSGKIVASCGREERNIEPDDASEVGGWLYVFHATNWDAWDGEVLYRDDDSIIVPGAIKDEGVVDVLDGVNSIREQIEQGDDFDRGNLHRD